MQFVDGKDLNKGDDAARLNEAYMSFKQELEGDRGFDGNKEGHFDWIVQFEGFSKFLQPSFTGVKMSPSNLEGEGEGSADNGISVLNIGCGTADTAQRIRDLGRATTSESESNKDSDSLKLKVLEVSSCDYDKACVEHMRKEYKDDEQQKWFVHDMIERQGELCGEDFDGKFQLIVDKGTLDAVHVEGAIYTMLAEVDRLLSLGGAYVCVSINSASLLKGLLGAPALGWDVRIYDLEPPEATAADITDKQREMLAAKIGGEVGDALKTMGAGSAYATGSQGVVCVCKKRQVARSRPLDESLLAQQEHEVGQTHFQKEQPLLTPELELRIREGFSSASGVDMIDEDGNVKALSLRRAYEVMDLADLGYVMRIEESRGLDLATWLFVFLRIEN